MRSVRKALLVATLLAALPVMAYAQTRRVTGQITVQGSNEPVPGATLQVVGTNLGGVADADGRFSVSVPAGPQQLRVRRIGFQPRVVPVGADELTLNIQLVRDVVQLETQVVTGAATTVSSVNAANDVAVVNSARLNQVPAPTLDQALQGKVAGAVISTNSGAPGGGSQITLRGASTILGNFSPLYVVDGVIVSNAGIANGLNTITHAASGTAVNFSSSQDQVVNRIADLNPDDIESVQILKGPSAASIYGSKGSNGVIIITTKQGRAGPPKVDFTQRFGSYYLANKLGPFRCFKSAAEVDAAGFDSTGYGAAKIKCHDYEQEFYGNHPLAYQTILSVRGGTTTGTSYYTSGLIQHDNGLAPNDYYNKQSLRINLGQGIGKRINIRTQTELIHTLTQRGISGNDNTGVNPYTIFSQTPSFIELRRQPDGTFPINPSPALPGSNPFQDAELVKTPENVYRLIGSATGTLSILSSDRQTLDFTLTGGIDAFNDQAKVIAPSSVYFEQVNSTPGTVVNSNGNSQFANLTGSLAHKLMTSFFTATTSAGFRQERRQQDVTQVTARGFPFVGVTAIDQGQQIFPNENQALTKDLSYFVQEEFLTLGERLFLTAGVNAERSSNNGDQRKFFAYPKFSASYRLPFLPSFVDEMKLRLAYGRAGNFPTAGRFTFATTLLDEGQAGARLSTIKGAKGIKPEISSETEGGFDATMFGGRVVLRATQFRKQIDELLLLAAIAPSTGFTSQYINGGQLLNHGTEVELDLTPFQEFHGFTWQSTTTYSSARGRVTRLPVAPFNPGVGSFGPTFGNVFIQQGLSPNIIQAYVGCKAPSPSGSCTSANRKLGFVGDATPDYQMGFDNSFTFSNFRLQTLLDWRKGGKVINLTNAYFDGGLQPDTAAGNARLRRLRQGYSPWIENAGFVKLREVTLSYAIPEALNRKLFGGRAQSTRLELSGRNLKTWTKYTGLDPEVSNFANQPLGRIQDVTPYPPSRSFFISLLTNF